MVEAGERAWLRRSLTKPRPAAYGAASRSVRIDGRNPLTGRPGLGCRPLLAASPSRSQRGAPEQHIDLPLGGLWGRGVPYPTPATPLAFQQWKGVEATCCRCPPACCRGAPIRLREHGCQRTRLPPAPPSSAPRLSWPCAQRPPPGCARSPPPSPWADRWHLPVEWPRMVDGLLTTPCGPATYRPRNRDWLKNHSLLLAENSFIL